MERTSRLPHLVRQAICLFGYSFYFSFALIFAGMMIPLSLIALPFGKSAALFHFGMNRALSLLVNQFLPLIRVCRIISFENRERLETAGPMIVIGNHRSWLDGPVIISHCRGITPIMKEGYANNPFYQIFTRWFDFISVNAFPRGVAVQPASFFPFASWHFSFLWKTTPLSCRYCRVATRRL